MQNLVKLAKQFKSDENGAAFVEYTVLLGIMLVGVIAVIGTVGGQLQTYWTTLTGALSNKKAGDFLLPMLTNTSRKICVRHFSKTDCLHRWSRSEDNAAE